MEDIRTAQESVNAYGKVASQHPTEEIELETYKSILEGIWSGIGKETDRTVHPRVLSQSKECISPFFIRINIPFRDDGLCYRLVEKHIQRGSC